MTHDLEVMGKESLPGGFTIVVVRLSLAGEPGVLNGPLRAESVSGSVEETCVACDRDFHREGDTDMTASAPRRRYQDGRDEMNLADFPISVLQRQQPSDASGQKLDTIHVRSY